MHKPTNGNLSAYEVNAVVPPNLITPLLELLQKNGGQLVHMISQQPAKAARPAAYGKGTAPDIILNKLEKVKGALHRADLRKVLEEGGRSPASVGPICSMLQKQGRVFSPRRGFWQIRA